MRRPAPNWIATDLRRAGLNGRALRAALRVYWAFARMAQSSPAKGRGAAHRLQGGVVASQRKLSAVFAKRGLKGLSKTTLSRVVPQLRRAGLLCLIESYGRHPRTKAWRQRHDPIYLVARSPDEAGTFAAVHLESVLSGAHRARTVAVVSPWRLIQAFLRGAHRLAALEAWLYRPPEPKRKLWRPEDLDW